MSKALLESGKGERREMKEQNYGNRNINEWEKGALYLASKIGELKRKHREIEEDIRVEQVRRKYTEQRLKESWI